MSSFKVKEGDIIGSVGNSERSSTGLHLHFELRINWSPVDPEGYIDYFKILFKFKIPSPTFSLGKSLRSHASFIIDTTSLNE